MYSTDRFNGPSPRAWRRFYGRLFVFVSLAAACCWVIASPYDPNLWKVAVIALVGAAMMAMAGWIGALRGL